ncbi:hypothetical protein CLIB1444_03S11606 [[Candida] jaroonii]|uniref:Uncharacterized protein n=1 Tax=[Candida] jaroonii TaxID=467808 RepID=A0ACA9Y6Q4_9ASCO|nr:hypothetical protein CLIB1444_03S11606 [[Candida] jaroonii]
MSSPDFEVNEFKDIALKLYKEEFVSVQPEEYIQFLASTDEESVQIRSYYMDLFKWDANLLKATRTLCSKLYLKGESQEIDRILTSFTKSYIKQNPVNVFCTKNFEKIYIVLYSLVLLNTSLHNSEVNKKSKISQNDYIRNTFTTFIQQDVKSSKKLSIKQRIIIEKELGNYYDDLLRNELHLKTSGDDEKMNHILDSTKDTNGVHKNGHEEHPESKHSHSNSVTTEDLSLSRQVSSSSIWSTDTANRASLNMKRLSSATSSVSQFTVTNNGRNNNRVGFTRALANDQASSRFYQQGNGSMVSNGTYGTIRNRQSIDKLRNLSGNQQNLNKRSSRASIISRDSLITNGDDSMSVVSFDSINLSNFQLDDAPQQNLENFNVSEFQDNFDLTLELQGSPYLKEGLLKLKILNNDQQDNNAPEPIISSAASTASTSTSTTSRFFSFFSRRQPITGHEPSNTINTNNPLTNNKFVEYFVVVSKGELNLYSFDPKTIKKHQQRIKKFQKKQSKNLLSLDYLDEEDEEDGDIGDGNWLKNAANVGNYNLCSTFSQIERSSLYVKSGSNNTFVFTITFPKTTKRPNKKFVFEAGTKEIALEFINTCNFWASKITAIPAFEESISSIEYGWNDLDNLIRNKPNFKKLKTIQKWEVLPTGAYLSNYDNNNENHYNMMKQFIKTLNYYNNLKKVFKEFDDLRVKFLKNFNTYSNTSNYSKITNNFEAKIGQYKLELKKYKNYLIILGFALQLRFDLEEEEKLLSQDVDDLGDGGAHEEADAQKSEKDENDTVVESSEGEDTKEPEEKETEVEEDDGETELSRLVKYEIRKLFIGLKDVGKIIPTFQTSKSISNLNELQSQIPNLTINDFNNSFNLVKSPKTFTLSNYNDDESPINQLLQTTKKQDMLHSFSHNTIEEEEEEEPEN